MAARVMMEQQGRYDPGPFLEKMDPAVRTKILNYLKYEDMLTLRVVSVSFRALIDHTLGLNVIANDNFPKNSHFVRRVKVKCLSIDFIRTDYSPTVRTFLKYPAELRELHIRCSILRPILQRNLQLFPNLVRIGLKDKALTCLDFFPPTQPAQTEEEVQPEDRLAFPFQNLEQLSLEVNFQNWGANEVITDDVKNRAWLNMMGYLGHVRSRNLNKFHFEFLDSDWTANEEVLAAFLDAHIVPLRDLSVKINFNRSDLGPIEPEFEVPDRLRNFCLHLGTFSPKIMRDHEDRDVIETTDFGLFWTKLINFQEIIESWDVSCQNQTFSLASDFVFDDMRTLKIIKFHELAIYDGITTKPKTIDFQVLADYICLEELHLHHAIFSPSPERLKGSNHSEKKAYRNRVRKLVRSSEAKNLHVLARIPNLKKVSLWGLLTLQEELLTLLDLPSLEELDLRACGIRGRYGVGNVFFEKNDLPEPNLPKYLGLRSLRIEDLNNDEVPEIAGYYQGNLAQQNHFSVTGLLLPLPPNK